MVLPILAKLLGEPAVREEVPHLLAQLVQGSPSLQAAAADADAIAKLAGFLLHDICTPRQLVGWGPRCGCMHCDSFHLCVCVRLEKAQYDLGVRSCGGRLFVGWARRGRCWR